MASKTARLAFSILALAGVTACEAASLVPMSSEIGVSQLVGIEPTAAAVSDRIGPPPAPAAHRGADSGCPEEAAERAAAAPAPSPDAVEVKLPPRVERNAKPAWRWKALLPGALK